DFIEDQAKHPEDNMTGDLLRLADEQPDLLNREDIYNIVFSIALAGHETTTNAITNALNNLLRDREQWRALCNDRSRLTNAVEESLRYDPSLWGWRRVAKVPMNVDGVEIPAGATLLLLVASANRDGARFEDPDKL